MSPVPVFVTVEAVLSSDGRYPDRAKAADQVVRAAAFVLALRLDQLFAVYPNKRPKITSGYRTPAANLAAGGAKYSSHLQGRACDFSDPDGEFAKWCLAHLDALEQAGLWMEDPDATHGWVHLQSREARSRVFKP